MKLNYLLFAILALFTTIISACGNGGSGLNGGMAVTAALSGSTITASATYTNPTETNLIGVPITFSIQIGDAAPVSLGTYNTNNSGTVNLSFSLSNFVGTQSVVIIATTGNLSNFASLDVTGRTMVVTPPPATTATTAAGVDATVTIAAFDSFVAIADPLSGDISNHSITVTGSSSNPTDTVDVTSGSVTNTAGIASFPGATITLDAPATAGTVTRVITWTVTDVKTGLTGTGVTVITLTAV